MVINFLNNEQSIMIDSDVIRKRSLAYAILLDTIRLFHNYDHLNTEPSEPYSINIDEASKTWWIDRKEFEREYGTITRDCWLHSSWEGEDWNFYFFF